jgi:hypothetical protein
MKPQWNRRSFLGAASLGGAELVLGGQSSAGAVPPDAQPAQATKSGRPVCYTTEWKRTKPDYVLYLPTEPLGNDGDNEHLLVLETPKGALLATWSQGTYEMSRDYRTVSSRSEDGGASWSKPTMVVGPTDHPGFTAAFAVPIASRKGRLYLVFNKHLGVIDASFSTSAVLRCIYSDDDGFTWKEGGDLQVRSRPEYDHPDPEAPKNIIFWQLPIRDAKDRPIVGFTRWSSLSRFPMANGSQGWYPDSRSEFLRFENIDDAPEPKDLRLTWLPEGDSISVPCPFEPYTARGYSLAEEPAMVLLPDDRLFVVMRTITGSLWYTVSEDADAKRWRKAEVLCYRDGGDKILHPKNPAPLYRLLDGRYLLFFQNHDGTKYGGKGPGDTAARGAPMFCSIGEYRPEAHQPIWFSPPWMFCNAENIAVGPGNGILEGGRTWLSFYGSMSFQKGRQILWYPDRKHFLLGRNITPEMLAKKPK